MTYSPLNLLHRDLKYSIIVNLNLADLLDLRCCNKEWDMLINDDKFWQRKLLHDFQIHHYADSKSCRDLYHEIAVTNSELLSISRYNKFETHCVARGVKKIISTTRHLVYIDVYDNVRCVPYFKDVRYPFTSTFSNGDIFQKRIRDAIFPCFSHEDVRSVVYLSTNGKLYIGLEHNKIVLNKTVIAIGGKYPDIYYITEKNELFYLKFGGVSQYCFLAYFIANNVNTAVITDDSFIYYLKSNGGLVQTCLSYIKENLQSYEETVDFTHRCLIASGICNIGYNGNQLYLLNNEGMVFQCDHNSGIVQSKLRTTLIEKNVKTLYPNADILTHLRGFGYLADNEYICYKHAHKIITQFYAQDLEKQFIVASFRIYDDK